MFADVEGGIELERFLSGSMALHPRVFHNGRYIEAIQREELRTLIHELSLQYFTIQERRAQIEGEVEELSHLEPRCRPTRSRSGKLCDMSQI
jgi:hypothetical protein